MRVLSFIVFGIVLTACGSGKGGNGGGGEVAVTAGATTDQTSVSKAYATLSALPSCDAAREGQLVYVKDIAKFQYCEAGVWQVATAVIPTPEVLKISKNVSCQAPLTNAQLVAAGLNGAPALGLYLKYNVSTLSNGMMLVESVVSYPGGQVSGTAIWTPEQNGAVTQASASMVLDLTTALDPGFWSMETVASGNRVVTYFDGDLGGTNKREFIFTTAQCTTNTY